MGRIVGIDLGTTYSAVAIPEERRGDGFFVVPGCPGCSLVLDERGRRITPSVVAEDREGQIVVGQEAKNRAGASPAPIMFAKRRMGEDFTFPLARHGRLTPEEVSAHILRHLKRMAEKRLGEPVEEAVITVPAYFGLRAKQMTEKAGELAGLRVAQVAPEPVAAALMYCAGDARDPLRIMTYDLGGGTFDVAILEKRDGVISSSSILSFDGDNLLGGYNFDLKLALWLAEHYGLELSPEDAVDRTAFAKLLVLAEQAKIGLSRETEYEMVEPNTGITDRHGRSLAIDLRLTRQLFEELIRQEIEWTIKICHRARTERSKREIPVDGFDEILMVGGSSRIPLIARRLEEEFKRKPRLVEPDLCVALGAAILAGTKPAPVGHLKLHPIPAETDVPTLSVTGTLLSSTELASPQGCTVLLRSNDGAYLLRRPVDGSGAFHFDGIELIDGETMHFTLTVLTASGRELERRAFTVKRTDAPRGGGLVAPVTNLLAKPIGIVTKDGTTVIAPERSALPHQASVSARTTDSTGQIRIPIVELNSALGEIVMRDLQGLPVDSEVQLTLTIQENYQIRGHARVPSMAREATVVISIPVPVRKSREELRRDMETVRAEAEEALAVAGTGAKFGDGRAKRLREQLDAARNMLADPHGEPARIEDCLDEIARLTRDLGKGWRPEPPKAVFDRMAQDALDLLKRAVTRKPHLADDGYDGRIAALRAEGHQAYAVQNRAAWKQCFTKLTRVRDDLEGLVEDECEGSSAGPSANQIFLTLEKRLEDLRRWAKEQGRYEDFQAEFVALGEALKRIDPSRPDALAKLMDWFNTGFCPLKDRLWAPESEDDQGLVSLAKSGAGTVAGPPREGAG